MAYELIYTSSRYGVNPGESGFCTVAYTQGLSANMIKLLEGLSIYSPYFPHYEENAFKNPVSFSHYLCNMAGQNFHILSRICFCGLDYTKRSNKLAHHIVLTEQETLSLPNGPASVLLAPGMMREQWNEQPKIFESSPKIQVNNSFFTSATTWEEHTGDAGWSAVIINKYLENPQKAVWFLFDPLEQTKLLNLVDEALNLLPETQRWQVTFNTYTTTLPIGVSCNWRFCPGNSTLLNDVRKNHNSFIFDLRKKMSNAPNTPLAEYARTGVKAVEDIKSPLFIIKADSTISSFDNNDEIMVSKKTKASNYVHRKSLFATYVLILIIVLTFSGICAFFLLHRMNQELDQKPTPQTTGNTVQQDSSNTTTSNNPEDDKVELPLSNSDFSNLNTVQGEWSFRKYSNNTQGSEKIIGIWFNNEDDFFEDIYDNRLERRKVSNDSLTGKIAAENTNAQQKDDFSFDLIYDNDFIKLRSNIPGNGIAIILTNYRALIPVYKNGDTYIIVFCPSENSYRTFNNKTLIWETLQNQQKYPMPLFKDIYNEEIKNFIKQCEGTIKQYKDVIKQCEDTIKQYKAQIEQGKGKIKQCEDVIKQCKGTIKQYEGKIKQCEEAIKSEQDTSSLIVLCNYISKYEEIESTNCIEITQKNMIKKARQRFYNELLNTFKPNNENEKK